jgi:hypothetical protein
MAMVHMRRQKKLKSLLTNMVDMWIVQTRLFMPFHTLLDLENEIEDMIFDVIDVHLVIEGPPSVFWFLTGETPQSFRELIASIRMAVEMPLDGEGTPKIRRLDVQQEVLLVVIWLRHYETYATLSTRFGVSMYYVPKIIHHVIMICSEIIVPREVYWHSLAKWDTFRGEYRYYDRSTIAFV